MKELLPPDVTQALLTSYYVSAHRLPTSQLMDHFEQWFLASLCLPSTLTEKDTVGSEGQCRGELIADVTGRANTHEKSPWQLVQERVQTEEMSAAVPALQLFASNGQHVGVANKCTSTPVAMSTSCLQSHTQTVLMALHLVYEVCDCHAPANIFLVLIASNSYQLLSLYCLQFIYHLLSLYCLLFHITPSVQELKLNALQYDSLLQLARLLIHISSCLGWKPYVDHYWRDFPHLRASVSIVTLPVEEEAMDDSSTFHTLPPPSPPHLLHWLAQTLRRRPVCKIGLNTQGFI